MAVIWELVVMLERILTVVLVLIICALTGILCVSVLEVYYAVGYPVMGWLVTGALLSGAWMATGKLL